MVRYGHTYPPPLLVEKKNTTTVGGEGSGYNLFSGQLFNLEMYTLLIPAELGLSTKKSVFYGTLNPRCREWKITFTIIVHASCPQTPVVHSRARH